MNNSPPKRIPGMIFILKVSVPAVLIISLLGCWGYLSLREQRYEIASRLHSIAASRIASELAVFVNRQIVTTTISAEGVSIIDFCKHPADAVRRKVVEQVFTNYQRNLPHLAFMSLVQVQKTSDNAHERVLLVDSVGGKSREFAVLDGAAIEAVLGGMPLFVGPGQSFTPRSIPDIVTVAQAVRDDDGAELGIIVMGIRTDAFLAFYAGANLYEHVAVEILDDRGFFVSTYDQKKVLNPDFFAEGLALLPHLDPSKNTVFFYDYQGISSKFFASPIRLDAPKAQQWWVVYRLPEAQLAASLTLQKAWIFCLCAVALFLTVSVAWLVRFYTSVRYLSREHLSTDAFFNRSPNPILILDAATLTVREANLAAEQLFAMGKDKFSGLPLSVFFPTEKDTGSRLAEAAEKGIALQACASNGQGFSTHCLLREYLQGATLLAIQPREELTRSEHRAATLEKKIEIMQELNDSMRHGVEILGRDKSDLLTNMSYEIRTPMHALLGLTHLLENTTLDAKQQEYLSKINSSASALLATINDVLDFAKLESEQVSLESIAFRPSKLLEDIHSLIGQACFEKGVTLNIRLQPEVPGVLVGDPVRLRQILTSFVQNALFFTDKGSITVSCDFKGTTADMALVRFAVSDTGRGISPENKEKLFQPLVSLKDANGAKSRGSNLGLVIARHSILAMGGNLTLESSLGAGTAISFTCRFATANSSAVAGVDTAHAAPQKVLAGRTVLVVEDEEINQEIAVEILKKAGATVFIASNGAEALEIVRAGRELDAVLMDLEMPVMDGYTATKEIRTIYTADELPIIALTARAFAEERVRCYECGVNDHLIKPFDIESLYSVLGRWTTARLRWK